MGLRQQKQAPLSDPTPFRRTYAFTPYKQQGTDSIQLYRDSTVKKFRVIIFGSYTASWASGTPVSNPLGAFALIDHVDVSLINGKGQRLVKSITPALAQRMQLLATGQFPYRRGQVGAAAVNLPNTNTVVPFGTTGQTTSVRESFDLSFEDMLAAGLSSQNTLLDLRGAIAANFKFYWAPINSVQAPGDTTTVTYSNISLNVQVVPIGESFAGAPKYDLVETYKQPQFVAADRKLIELPVGNAIRGILLFVQNGDASRTFFDQAITNLRIKADGVTKWETDFLATQDGNRNQFAGLNAPLASGVSAFDGCAYLDFCNAKIQETCIDLTNAKQAYLEAESVAGGVNGTSYVAAPVTMNTLIQELVLK